MGMMLRYGLRKMLKVAYLQPERKSDVNGRNKGLGWWRWNSLLALLGFAQCKQPLLNLKPFHHESIGHIGP